MRLMCWSGSSFQSKIAKKIAVVGLGGVGKTQVVLKFAYSVLEKHPEVSVFWVHAQSLETFEQTCTAVASVLGILGTGEDKKDVKELFRRYLSAEKAGKWVLVVDNADDLGVLERSDGKKGILDYLPESELGLMVFTTRDKTTAQALAGNNILDVEKLDLATASALFEKMLTQKDTLREEAVVEELLQELDCLPLAITQAAAYVNCNAMSVEEYLRLLRSTEQDLIFIMKKEMRDNTRYRHTTNAVAKTWLVSFEQIVRQDADAAGLLQFMSCIDWKAIPRSILPAVKPEARMVAAIGTLWSYSLITTRSDDKTYDMHRLVHLAARVWMQQKGLIVETQRKALEHLSEVFPKSVWSNREAWREFIPHAARMRDAQGGGPIGARGLLCLKVGRCLQVDGRIRDAVGWLEDSRDLRSNLPEDDADRLATQYWLAISYESNRQVKDAVRLLEHVVAIERVLAEENPSRLTSQHALAIAYESNKQVKDAVQLLEHVVAIGKRVPLAEYHPDLLASQHALALAYGSNRQVKDAVQLLEHVVAIQKRAPLAEDHPHLLASQHALAMAYESSGQVKDAVQLLEHVVAVRDRALVVEDRPDLLVSQHNLAWAYLGIKQHKEAVQLLEHVVAIQGQVLPEDHPDRLLSRDVLAQAYKAAGQTAKLESQPSSQADEQEAGPSSAARSTARRTFPLLANNHRNTRPVHGGSPQVKGERTGARGTLKQLWQKLKEKR